MYRAYLREPPTDSSGLMTPAWMAAVMTWDVRVDDGAIARAETSRELEQVVERG